MKKQIKCIVAAINPNGESDLFFVIIEGTDDQIEADEHLAEAIIQAEGAGYDPYVVYDENNSAGKAMLPLFQWETASIFPIDKPTLK